MLPDLGGVVFDAFLTFNGSYCFDQKLQGAWSDLNMESAGGICPDETAPQKRVILECPEDNFRKVNSAKLHNLKSML